MESSHLNQFKRVRNVKDSPSSTFQVIVSEKEHLKALSDELAAKLTNVTDLELPVDRILTRTQYEVVLANYWPLQFQPDKRVGDAARPSDIRALRFLLSPRRCAMALLHARVSKCFYLLPTKFGYLNTQH